ncbi:WSC domain-containing protein 2, partial [Xenoophorus captivus]
GNAIFKGCFHRPDNVTAALPFSAVIQNMSVDKCVDMCTEKEKSLAALAGEQCYCGFPTPLFSLHELEDEDMCLHRCPGEEFESCGNDKFFVVYQTQVQGRVCFLLTAQSNTVCKGKMTMEACQKSIVVGHILS